MSSDLREQICDEFEAAWEAGKQPNIEDCIAQQDPADARKLLPELLVIEWEYRRKRGESYDVAEYCQRFPEASEFIQTALRETLVGPPPSYTVVEDVKSQTAWTPVDNLEVVGKLDAVRLHAVGGLGEVYVAADKALHREVAVKRIKPQFSADAESMRRFQLEAEITGRLEHPGIVPLHGLGRDGNGNAFYVMKFIRGETLSSAIVEFFKPVPPHQLPANSLQFRKLLNHFIASCQTIAYAHSEHVIHRDLKPDNIMLGRYGETMVVDWGLARDLNRFDTTTENQDFDTVSHGTLDSSKTALGQALGTPAFMSPEQAKGIWDEIDERTDVYGLGATLFSILTGKAPFAGSLDSVMQAVRQGNVVHPRSIRRYIPRPLAAICLKAMRLNPQERYQTAAELAAEIEAYLGDKPVSAYREPFWGSGLRLLRQRLPIVLAAMLVLAVASTTAISLAYNEEQKAKQYAAQQARLAESQAKTVSEVSEIIAGLKLDGAPTGLLGRDYKDPDLLNAAARVRNQLADTPSTQARILDAIGEHFAMSGDLRKAEEFLLPALKNRQANPENVADLASSLHHVAFLRWVQGRLGESRQLASQAIKYREEVYGAQHEKTVASRVLYLVQMSELAELYDPAVLIACNKRFTKAWQEILAENASKLDEADKGAIHTVLAICQGYLALNDKQANGLTSLQLANQAWQNYQQGQAAFANTHGVHPGALLAKLYETSAYGLLSSNNDTLSETIELSKQAFHSNESHPGNLVIRRLLIAHRDAEAEAALRQVRDLAKPVFGNEPRAADFDADLAELLFHRGLNTNDLSAREDYFSESEALAEEAQHCWEQSIGPATYQVAEAYKKRARIARAREDWQGAEQLFRLSVTTFDKAQIRGYSYGDYQARAELIQALRKLGRDEEAQEIEVERQLLRAELLSRIPQVVEKVFAGVPTLGLK
ncbi:MAG: serine/threonine protein kinase [Planctomycetales bacterium]|nr:serine/threonine protein kinase [Planctomycetales bacterium]